MNEGVLAIERAGQTSPAARQIFVGDTPCVLVEGVRGLDIAKTFDCGQCFRFDAVKDSVHQAEFSGVAYGRVVSFGQDGERLYIYGSTLSDYQSIWRAYLDIERSYDSIAEDILCHTDTQDMRRAIERGRGIRILGQDPFECIISFIISQNNNIPRIKKIIESLCARCGEPIALPQGMEAHVSHGGTLYAFPSAKAIGALGVEGLLSLKTGFRAGYIYDAVCRILDGSVSIEQVGSQTDTEAAIEQLCRIKGVGRKVASCALLFGFAKYDAFPIDVWMKRVGEKYFPDVSLSPAMFGRYAGIAQQYLFYYERYLASDEK